MKAGSACLFLLAACGSSFGFSSPSSTSSSNIEAGSVNVTPALAQAVGRSATFVLTYTDAASADGVSLTNDTTGKTVAVWVTANDKVLTVQPQARLDPLADYTLRATSFSGSFHTALNAASYEQRPDTTDFNQYDGSGHKTDVMSCLGRLSTEQQCTNVFTRITYGWPAGGALNVGDPDAVFYGGPGPDNVWKTADDVVSQYYLNVGHGAQRSCLDAGSDGVWMTEDDAYCSWGVKRPDPSGGDIRYDTQDIGPDAIPGTDDDVVDGCGGVNALGQTIEAAYSLHGTAKDICAQRVLTSYTVVTSGRFTTYNSDGTVASYESQTQGIGGQRQTFFDAAGADGQWFTADDHASRRNDWVIDDQGFAVGESTYEAGADGVLNTDDDVLSHYDCYDTAH